MTATTSPRTTSPGDIHDPTSAAYKKARRKHFKSTRNRPEQVDAEWTPFRAAEKRYKARFPPPDLSDVLDLAAADPTRAEEIARGKWHGCADAVQCTEIPLRNGRTGIGYTFPGTPGLIFLPAFIAPSEQRRLVRWALCEQAKHPNETNLDTHYVLPHEGVWNQYAKSWSGEGDDAEVFPRATAQGTDTLSNQATGTETPGPRKLISNEPASTANYVELASTPKPPAPPSQTLRPVTISSLVPRLRWANIGWYYHWGTKQYDFTRGPGDISPLVRDLCKGVVESIPWERVFGDSEGQAEGRGRSGWGEDGPDWMDWKETYEPDAGIVNFYQTKDTLMAHVDRSEISATSPLVSISLGCAAVFLIGGLTRDDPPTPILLRSGDVVVMSGPACRRAYHGVPRILEGTLPSHMEGGDDWDIYEEYLRATRINVNVRQVFPKGFDPGALDLSQRTHHTNP
ncbi:uncharacterized protein TRAVEDRAFT_36424 [Trametes versicolor FP-101664 SS1]|uniref:uncharacterized protein n=1 Tax=Trametes versicolor (strain FP-101664) TaxID=717944 RepID=UPI0004623483|nr:uncharacterized protein TRAVEDRAFT_36424 [Trametes versicolor FP-101664 SS1]EIW60838.1 hypothetical protein TRAVEDRAFT_36424 [Trametes versicolor FP-101664 SS1]